MQKTIEIANVVLRFGDDVLLDSFNDRFWKPLKNNKGLRGRGETKSYILHQLELAVVDKRPVAYGRIIKRLEIEAEQDYDDSKRSLVESDESISSAPSSFFLLDLASHRMAFLHETRRNPSLRDFEYVVERILTQDWILNYKKIKEEWLEKRNRDRFPRGEKDKIEAELEKKYPRPDFRVTPLPAIKDMGNIFSTYEKLTSVGLIPLQTNDEFPDENEKFLQEYDKLGSRTNAKKSKTEFKNSKDGLNKKEVRKLVKSAANGNYKVNLVGKDEHGEDLKSNLDEIRVTLREEIPRRASVLQLAQILLKKLIGADENGLVSPRVVSKQMIANAHKAVENAE